MKHRFDVLDIFRGIFASLVVLFHMALSSDTPVLNNQFIDHADVFVDFFFVLSGFVITYRYQAIATTQDFSLYFSKRILRIYPLHLFMLAIFLIMEVTKKYMTSYVHINQLDNENNNVVTFFTSLFLLNSVKLFGVKDLSWNIPSWSISAEMISYFFFGVCMLFIAQVKLTRWKKEVYALVVLLNIAILYAVTGAFRMNYGYDYGFLRGLIGFFMGAVCFCVFQQVYPRWHTGKESWFSVAEFLSVVLIFLAIYFGAYLKDIGVVYDLIFFIPILIFSFEKGFVSKFLKRIPFLHKVGLYSYSIYLTHPFTLSIFNILFIRILHFQKEDYSYLFILNYAFIFLFARWTYHHVEMKFKDYKWLDSLRGSPKRTLPDQH